MYRFLALACFLVTAQGASLPAHLKNIFPNGKIVGGEPTTIDKVPWQVALEDNGYLFCGGSIISANYVLTAASCTEGKSPNSIRVRSGSAKLGSGGIITSVAYFMQNPNFDDINFDYDVSVLKLSSPLFLNSNQSPVTLRTAEAGAGETAQVTGWGILTSGGENFPSSLQALSVPVVDHSTCNSIYNGEVTARMICAGAAGKDSCQGDTGGALTIRGLQVGIASSGNGCALDGYPGIYSNVATLREFIDQYSNNEAQWSSGHVLLPLKVSI